MNWFHSNSIKAQTCCNLLDGTSVLQCSIHSSFKNLCNFIKWQSIKIEKSTFLPIPLSLPSDSDFCHPYARPSIWAKWYNQSLKSFIWHGHLPSLRCFSCCPNKLLESLIAVCSDVNNLLVELDEGVKLPTSGEAQEAEGFSIRFAEIVWLGVQVVPGNP